MYGSRSDHSKSRPKDDIWDRRKDVLPKALAIVEGLLDDSEPAMLTMPDNIDALHSEALSYNALPAWERELLLPWTDEFGDVHETCLVEVMPDPIVEVAWSSDDQDFLNSQFEQFEREDMLERDARYDEAYDGYSDDPDCGDHSGCWLPFMRIEELRDTFGENWLGNGFHIVQGNGIRRSA